jgi:putative tricarboxylic transport membrane protein
MGMVLGPMLEESLRRAMIMSQGDPSIFVLNPISAIFLALSAALVLATAFPYMRHRREEIFVAED